MLTSFVKVALQVAVIGQKKQFSAYCFFFDQSH